MTRPGHKNTSVPRCSKIEQPIFGIIFYLIVCQGDSAIALFGMFFDINDDEI
jgi:hypothetical protein